jgi:hypothetical protein
VFCCGPWLRHSCHVRGTCNLTLKIRESFPVFFRHEFGSRNCRSGRSCGASLWVVLMFDRASIFDTFLCGSLKKESFSTCIPYLPSFNISCCDLNISMNKIYADTFEFAITNMELREHLRPWWYQTRPSPRQFFHDRSLSCPTLFSLLYFRVLGKRETHHTYPIIHAS